MVTIGAGVTYPPLIKSVVVDDVASAFVVVPMVALAASFIAVVHVLLSS